MQAWHQWQVVLSESVLIFDLDCTFQNMSKWNYMISLVTDLCSENPGYHLMHALVA